MSDWEYDASEWATGGWGYDEGGYGEEAQIITKPIDTLDFLHEPIVALIRKRKGDDRYWSREPIYLVTDARWSGYSEFTVTSTWEEVHVHWADVDLHWGGLAEFIRELADANPPEERL